MSANPLQQQHYSNNIDFILTILKKAFVAHS